MSNTDYKKQQILHFHRLGNKPPTISHLMREEGLVASPVGVYKFLNKFKDTDSITRRPCSGRPTKVTDEIKSLMEQQMNEDDETTAVQLHTLLVQNGYNLSL